LLDFDCFHTSLKAFVRCWLLQRDVVSSRLQYVWICCSACIYIYREREDEGIVYASLTHMQLQYIELVLAA
jgi:hypothetical protein